MNLISKTILIGIAVVGFFSIVLYIVSTIFISGSYNRLEDENFQRDLKRAANAIEDRLSLLRQKNMDWAVWDESYNFVPQLSNEYIEKNLSDNSFVNADFSLAAFFDNSADLVYYRFIDLENGGQIHLSQSDKTRMQGFVRDISIGQAESSTGLIGLESGPLMASAHPLLHNDGSGPANGILVLGRSLTPGVIEDIAGSTQLNFSIQSKITDGMTGMDGEDLAPLFSGTSFFIYKPGSESANSYQIINGFDNQPCILIQIQSSRDIYAEGQRTIFWLHAFLLGFSIVFVIMAFILIYALIVGRLKKLTAGLYAIYEKNDLSIRMPVKGKDEITVLSRQVNSTLDKIAAAQSSLAASEERFRIITETASDVIYQAVLKPDLKLEYISPSIQKTMGYSVDEALQDPHWMEKAVFTEDRQKMKEAFNQAERLQHFGMVLRWLHKDGRVVWMEHNNSVILDKTAGQFRILGIGRNITERIRMEGSLVESYQKEKEMRLEMEKESMARSFFIDVLGHELKTPMTPLLISLDILKDKTDPESTALQTKLINNAFDSARLLSARVDELLDLTRFARGTFRLEPQEFNARDYLENTTRKILPSLKSRRQRLITLIAPELGRIKADPFRLEKVILNLLSNASKYSEDEQEIFFRARKNNGMLEVEVEDHGAGLTVEEQSRLFEPYHRVEQDRQKFTGLGLGLAVARQIVEAHGGQLSVTSEVGSGSIFRFTIPLDSR